MRMLGGWWLRRRGVIADAAIWLLSGACGGTGHRGPTPARSDADDAPAIGVTDAADAPGGGDARDAEASDAGHADAQVKGDAGGDGPQDGRDARDAPSQADARDGLSADAAPADAAPDSVGSCSEARLLEQARMMVEAWTDRMRVCEPEQATSYGTNNFVGDITRDACIGNECGAAGMCAVDFDWYAPFTVARDGRGQLSVSTLVHAAPRCTVRYTHGVDTCLCHVDPTLTGVWRDQTWMAAGLSAVSTGTSGLLTFSVGTVQVSDGPGARYGVEVVSCEGSLVGTDSIDRCTLSPSTSNLAMRSAALGDCDNAATQWFVGLSDLFRAYAATFSGSCP